MRPMRRDFATQKKTRTNGRKLDRMRETASLTVTSFVFNASLKSELLADECKSHPQNLVFLFWPICDKSQVVLVAHWLFKEEKKTRSCVCKKQLEAPLTLKQGFFLLQELLHCESRCLISSCLVVCDHIKRELLQA